MTETAVDIEFKAWPKITRLARTVYVTEKIDGTNAAIGVTDDGTVYAQSRTRIITPESDNFGFAAWVDENQDDLRQQLGGGLHFGEWWGSGIQRGYGLPKGERRFSLFNAIRWTADPNNDLRCIEAPLCHVVPILGIREGFEIVDSCLDLLRANGSEASPGFMKPEGVVAFHAQSNSMFKRMLEKDDEWKGKSA